jgi:hypothetical protein
MKLSPRLEEYRFRAGKYASPARASWGAFDMPGPCGARLVIVATDGSGGTEDIAVWEHVSVSTEKRIPNWIEMCFVKDLFWDANDCVVQFHPSKADYVNNHPRTLHLWRWTGGAFPTPSSIMVGVKDGGIITSSEQANELERRALKQVFG